MPSSTTPESFFTHTIQPPARGSAATVPENSPTATSSAVIPSENTNRYTKPNTPLRVVATQVNTAANAGAPHGAATIPDVAPSKKTAGYDPPPRPDTQRIRRCGAEIGITSSMASANTSSRFPIANRAHGLALTVPNSDPDSPAMRPRIAENNARPVA